MQAAVFLGREKIEVQQVPTSVCGDCELLLRVEIIRICGTDVKTYFQGGRGKLQPPHIIGQEIAGTVVQVGTGVRGYSEGDHVALACCINAQRFLQIGAGDSVVVMGGGGMRCIHALLARQEPIAFDSRGSWPR